MSNYVCSNCGTQAHYDSRCSDTPILMCGCHRRGSRWINDGRGGYATNPSNAVPVEGESYQNDNDLRWDNDRR